MKTLRNLTLHEQGKQELSLAARAGFALRPGPEGPLVPPGEEGLRSATRSLAKSLRDAALCDEAVLIGGHTGVWLAAVLLLVAERHRVPTLYYFDTRRHQDEAGRFVFIPERLVRVEAPAPSAQDSTA